RAATTSRCSCWASPAATPSSSRSSSRWGSTASAAPGRTGCSFVCGIFGIHSGQVDVANLTYFGLFALQHRGQESAGIAVGDGQNVRVHRGMGLVAQVFSPAVMSDLDGGSIVALGHTRYSTTGASRAENAHPVPLRHPTLG